MPPSSRCRVEEDDDAPCGSWVGVVVAIAFGCLSCLVAGGLTSQPVYSSALLQREMQASRSRLYLLVLGRIYDVSKGRTYYAPGKAYHNFCLGTDHSRAYRSANFELDSTDDLDGLSPGDCLEIQRWADLYVDKTRAGEYRFLGLHIGRFYDRRGEKTAAFVAYEDCVKRGRALIQKNVAAAGAAPSCTRSMLAHDPKRPAGTWEKVACEPPLVPRRSGMPEDDERCLCVTVLPDVEPCRDMDGAPVCAQAAADGLCEESASTRDRDCALTCGTCTPDDQPSGSWLGSPVQYERCEARATSCEVIANQPPVMLAPRSL